jgi:hypothetical protein
VVVQILSSWPSLFQTPVKFGDNGATGDFLIGQKTLSVPKLRVSDLVVWYRYLHGFERHRFLGITGMSRSIRRTSRLSLPCASSYFARTNFNEPREPMPNTRRFLSEETSLQIPVLGLCLMCQGHVCVYNVYKL